MDRIEEAYVKARARHSPEDALAVVGRRFNLDPPAVKRALRAADKERVKRGEAPLDLMSWRDKQRPCHKLPFDSRGAARKAMRSAGRTGRGFNYSHAYCCSLCGKWHLTTKHRGDLPPRRDEPR